MQSKNITQPPDWWEAFQREADNAGVSLSSWMGDACLVAIGMGKSGKTKVGKLSERPLASLRLAKNNFANFANYVHTSLDVCRYYAYSYHMRTTTGRNTPLRKLER